MRRVALSRSIARAAACAQALGSPACAGSRLLLRYCEDEAGRVISCDCARAPREVAGGRVGQVEVHESYPTPRGTKERTYRSGRDLQFVLRGRWFVIEVNALSSPATAMLAWLRCDGLVVPGETVHRSTVLGGWDTYRHEFLALFPADDGDDLATPQCQLHVAIVGPFGAFLTRQSEPVYLVNRTSQRAAPLAEDNTWNVAIRVDPAPSPTRVRATLEPALAPPQPRLCRGAAREPDPPISPHAQNNSADPPEEPAP